MNTIQKQLNDILAQFIGQPNTADTQKAVLATVRQIVPNLLANDIVGVQPMDMGAFYAPYIPLQFYKKDTRVFTKKPMNFSRAKWYRVDVEPKDWEDALDWAEAQFGRKAACANAWSRWYTGLCSITFRDEADYIMFTLRWA